MNTHPHPYHPNLVLRAKESTRHGAAGDLLMPKRVMPHDGGGTIILCHAFSITAPDSPACRSYDYTVDGGKTWHPAHEAPHSITRSEDDAGASIEQDRWEAAQKTFREFCGKGGKIRVFRAVDMTSVIEWESQKSHPSDVLEALMCYRIGIENGDLGVDHLPPPANPEQKPEMSEGERKSRSERWKSAVEACRIFAQSTVGALRIVTTRDVFSDPAASYVVDWFAPSFNAARVSLDLHREGIENGDFIVVHKPDMTPAKPAITPEHRLGAAFREVCKLRGGAVRYVEFRNQTNPCHWAVTVAPSFDSAVEHLAQASEGVMSGRITVNAITHP